MQILRKAFTGYFSCFSADSPLDLPICYRLFFCFCVSFLFLFSLQVVSCRALQFLTNGVADIGEDTLERSKELSTDWKSCNLGKASMCREWKQSQMRNPTPANLLKGLQSFVCEECPCDEKQQMLIFLLLETTIVLKWIWECCKQFMFFLLSFIFSESLSFPAFFFH